MPHVRSRRQSQNYFSFLSISITNKVHTKQPKSFNLCRKRPYSNSPIENIISSSLSRSRVTSPTASQTNVIASEKFELSFVRALRRTTINNNIAPGRIFVWLGPWNGEKGFQSGVVFLKIRNPRITNTQSSLKMQTAHSRF